MSNLVWRRTDEPRLNVSRVKNRVLKGGHDVDTEKILTRYSNTLKNLYSALKLVDRAYLFDNSDEMLMIDEKEDETLRININEQNFTNINDWKKTYSWYRLFCTYHFER